MRLGYRIGALLIVSSIAFSNQANIVQADCLACFELKGVQIELKNGRMLGGYVQWNSVWFKERENAIFPDSLLSSGSWQYTPLEFVRLYKEVHKVKHPLTVLVTTRTGALDIALSDIKKMVPTPQEHDGYQGASGLPLLSQTAIRLLSEGEPYALFKDDSGVTDVYLISFTRDINVDKLGEIHAGLRSISPEEVTKLEESQVIYLSIPYD